MPPAAGCARSTPGGSNAPARRLGDTMDDDICASRSMLRPGAQRGRFRPGPEGSTHTRPRPRPLAHLQSRSVGCHRGHVRKGSQATGQHARVCWVTCPPLGWTGVCVPGWTALGQRGWRAAEATRVGRVRVGGRDCMAIGSISSCMRHARGWGSLVTKAGHEHHVPWAWQGGAYHGTWLTEEADISGIPRIEVAEACAALPRST